MDNFNPYDNKNDLYTNVYNETWSKTLDNLSSDEKTLELFVNNFRPNDNYKYDIENINEYVNTNLKGGSMSVYESLGIELEEYKYSTEKIKTNKYIVTSLFDAYVNLVEIPFSKNIKHYSLCLYQSILLYLEKLPDYNIRIYGDRSLTPENHLELQILFELIDTNPRIEYFYVTQSFNDTLLFIENKHIGLLGALFRFYILLDPNASLIISVDADNFPTEIFIDYIKKFEKNTNDGILIFKPYYYARKNIMNECIQQLLAGMSGIKKQKGQILNPEIFVLLINYLDKQYERFKNKFMDYCDNNLPVQYKTPFQFGFEEQALTNILLPYFILNKKDINIIPMYFDFGKYFNFYYNEILNCLSPTYYKIIKNVLSIHKYNTYIICYVTPTYGYNIHIGIILVGFIYRCIKNKKFKINGKNIFNPDKINDIKRYTSIIGFYHMYPSFNLTIDLDTINYYIDNLFNGNHDNLDNLSLEKLPKQAKKEFGQETNFYDSYIQPDLEHENIIKENPIINILNRYKKRFKKDKFQKEWKQMAGATSSVSINFSNAIEDPNYKYYGIYNTTINEYIYIINFDYDNNILGCFNFISNYLILIELNNNNKCTYYSFAGLEKSYSLKKLFDLQKLDQMDFSITNMEIKIDEPSIKFTFKFNDQLIEWEKKLFIAYNILDLVKSSTDIKITSGGTRKIYILDNIVIKPKAPDNNSIFVELLEYYIAKSYDINICNIIGCIKINDTLMYCEEKNNVINWFDIITDDKILFDYYMKWLIFIQPIIELELYFMGDINLSNILLDKKDNFIVTDFSLTFQNTDYKTTEKYKKAIDFSRRLMDYFFDSRFYNFIKVQDLLIKLLSRHIDLYGLLQSASNKYLKYKKKYLLYKK